MITCIHILSELYIQHNKRGTIPVSPVKNDDTWLFTTHLVDPKTGDRIHKTRRGYKSLQEAEETEYKFRREYFKAKVEGCQITFKEMFIKYMTSRKQKINPTTYKKWLNLHPMAQKKILI
ncbi:Arm DNA-binding domain-containing protein [Amedibacillus sp. YH-ame6]